MTFRAFIKQCGGTARTRIRLILAKGRGVRNLQAPDAAASPRHVFERSATDRKLANRTKEAFVGFPVLFQQPVTGGPGHNTPVALPFTVTGAVTSQNNTVNLQMGTLSVPFSAVRSVGN